jgi:hypothetical protein
MVCGVKQGSEGMGSQPAGVEEGVAQPQSGAEVAGALVERGQDVVGNEGQGGQQRHLRALQRIWRLGSKTCYTLERERGRMEDGRRFPGQGKRRCRRGGLLHPEELERVRENS